MQKIIYIYLVGCFISGLVLIKDFYLSGEDEIGEVKEQLSVLPKQYWNIILFLTVCLVILSSWYYVYKDIYNLIIKGGE